MTKIIAATNAVEYLPVRVKIYNLLDRDIFKTNDAGERVIVARKGQPNFNSFVTMNLARCVIPGQVQSVGDKLKEVKAMLVGSNYKVHIESAPETEHERKARYERDGLEVVSQPNSMELVTPTPIISITKAVSDEDLGISEDNGKIKSKKRVRHDEAVAA